MTDAAGIRPCPGHAIAVVSRVRPAGTPGEDGVSVAEDFARNPPAAVVVDPLSGIPGCPEPAGAFDLITYFSRHPLFAETWSHYRLVGKAGGFRVYARKD